MSAKILQKHHVCGKDYIWSPSTSTCENGKYLESIIGDSIVICDGIIEVKKAFSTKTVLAKSIPIKTIPTNFNEKN